MKSKFSLLTIVMFACLNYVEFFNDMMNACAADVAVDIANKKQIIDGFGASSAWSGAMSDKIFNGLYTDCGYSILRVRIEDLIGDNWKSGNFSSWASELSNAKKAIARGAIVFASPWSPPKSMQESFSHPRDNTNPFRVNYNKYEEYLQYLNGYLKYFKDNGAELYAISIQNEPDYADGWCWWTATEILNFLKTYGDKINSRVIAPESFQFIKSMSDPILNDATALANIDILGFHLYGTQVKDYAYPLFEQKGRPAGKKLWETEHFLGDNANITISNVVTIAKEVHDCMVTGNHNAYVYWWIPHANGLTATDGSLYKRAYAIGQFSKYVRPGYYRVDATATPATNLYVSAYSSVNKVVIVAVNTGTGAVNQKFTLKNGTTDKLSSFQTTSATNMSAGEDYQVSGGSFSASLPGQSITTFVGNLTGTMIEKNISKNFQQQQYVFQTLKRCLMVSPLDKNSAYNVSISLLNGKNVTIRNGIKGNLIVPFNTDGTYIVKVTTKGYFQQKMVTVY